jgi:hypothetical protein
LVVTYDQSRLFRTYLDEVRKKLSTGIAREHAY